MNLAMRIRALLLISGVLALAACGEPLGKQAMIAGCRASAAALEPALTPEAMDYRAVVGREAILRFQVTADGGAARAVNAKCKVSMRGHLKRIKLDAARVRGAEFERAQAAFAAATGR